MAEFIVHIHNHAGWKKNRVDAATQIDAIKAEIYRTHEWLSEYPHEIKFDGDDATSDDHRYAVYYTGEVRTLPLGFRQYPGDLWFSDFIRVGEEDDCKSCGGTGINHYYHWCQCWRCGEKPGKQHKAFYAEGRSSGKEPRP